MDSAALGVLVGALRKMETHDGSLSLVCTRERLLKIFRITHLDKAFEIHPDVASAI
jgi:anti-sigma B factor antagonist